MTAGGLLQVAGTLSSPATVPVGTGGLLAVHQLTAPGVDIAGGLLTAAEVDATTLNVTSKGGVTAFALTPLILNVTGTLSVDSTSGIGVSGLGYAPGYTTGNTTAGGATGRSGGSYGGLGQDDRGTTNAAYGDYTNPDDFGSGGGPGGGAGGGLVRITAATLDLDGQVLADGGDAGYDDSGGYGGGSGGGIYVSVTTLSGAGLIEAASGDINGGGFAGGGRVAVYAADFSGFNVANITAPAGGHGGSAGTVYLKTTGDAQGTLIIDPGPTGYVPGFTPLGTSWPTAVPITPGGLPAAHFPIPDAVVIRGLNTRVIPAIPELSLDFQSSLTITSSAQLLMPGDLALDATTSLQLTAGGLLSVTGTLTSPVPLVVVGGSLVAGQVSVPSLEMDGGGLSAGQVNATTLDVINTAVVTTNSLTPLILDIGGTLSVDSTSRIDVSDLGYGPGRTVGNSPIGGTTGTSGGSYGGLGGAYGGTTNLPYGDYTNPDDFGSGGGTTSTGSAGGGLVRITATTLDLDGQILANGNAGQGPGSGGGIFVSVTTLMGAGSIEAAGGLNTEHYGNGGPPGGGGGGGRVAVYAADFSGFNTSLITAPGQYGDAPGGAGTVYLRQSGAASGTLILAEPNGANSNGDTPLGLPGETSHLFPDAVVISGYLTYVVPESPGLALDFQNGLTITNSGTLQTNGELTLGGTVNWSGGSINGNGTLNLAAGSELDISGTSNKSLGAAIFNNAGTVKIESGSLAISSAVSQVAGNVLTGGNWVVLANATLNLSMAGAIATNQGNITLGGSGATFTNLSGLSENDGALSLLGVPSSRPRPICSTRGA